jgi:head-tail adaptor
MREVISITAPSGSYNPHGERTFAAAVNRFAAVESVKHADRAAATGALAEVEVKATIRYEDLDAASRVTWRTVQYDIVGIEHDGRLTETTLLLKRR